MPENQRIRLLDFLDEIENKEKNNAIDNEFKNSDEYKLKMIDRNRECAKDDCLTNILSDTYQKAIPLNDEYKIAYKDDIDKCFRDFLNERCPKGVEYYIKEGIKKKSKFAEKVLESVNKMINTKYNNLALHVEEVTDEDLVFNNNKDDQKKVDVIGKELNTDEVADIVKDNVKNTAVSEIQRAKEEKEKLQSVENELANDVKMNTPQKVEEAMELRGLGMRDYKPTLFTAMTIGKLNEIQKNPDCCNTNTYNALKDYPMSRDSICPTPEELAFIGAIREYTKYALVKALKLESFDKYKIEDLAQRYAENK